MKYDELIKKAISVSMSKTIPPKFDEEEGKNNTYNCYAHIMLMDGVDFKYTVTLGEWQYEETCEIMPGFLSGPVDIGDDRVFRKLCSMKILDRIREDLKILHRELSESDGSIKEGSYNIIIYVDEEYGPHFIRQNEDGRWSEKPGYLLDHPAQITSLELQDVESTCLGVFRISSKKE